VQKTPIARGGGNKTVRNRFEVSSSSAFYGPRSMTNLFFSVFQVRRNETTTLGGEWADSIVASALMGRAHTTEENGKWGETKQRSENQVAFNSVLGPS
jgi:hypothetical protein